MSKAVTKNLFPNSQNKHIAIVLKLGKGNLETGYPDVKAEVWEIDLSRKKRHKLCADEKGSLPPCPELLENHQNWKKKYEALLEAQNNNNHHHHQLPPGVTEENDNELDRRLLEVFGKEEEKLLNQWLRCESFDSIRIYLYEYTKFDDRIQLFVETDDEQTRDLFWHLWDFFEKRPFAQPVLGVSQRMNYIPESQTPLGEVKILAIFGDTKGINIENDRQILNRLERYDAKISYLEEPTREKFTKQLWQEQWDILFFAGHSLTEDSRGFLQFNGEEFVSPDELTKSINNAVANGLQLAIINSCDGLGIGRTLDSLSVPTSIVMHEPIHDRIAVEFLKGFLDFFARGFSLPVAVKKARGQLEGIKNEYPYATWLPVVCQNPDRIPPTWNSLKNHGKFFWKMPIITTAIVSSFVIGIRFLGVLQGLELANYDRMMRARHWVRPLLGLPKYEEVDDRILLVVQDDKNKFPAEDKTIVEVIDKLNEHNPNLIGLDMLREKPKLQKNVYYAKLMDLFQENNNLIGICRRNDPTFVPPLYFRENSSKSSLAYTNIPTDKGGILRRVTLMTQLKNEDEPCYADHYLATLLAFRYLYNKGIKPRIGKKEEIIVGKTIFPQIPKYNGFYGHKKLAGYSILLNYRVYNSNKPETIPFRIVTFNQLLNNQVETNFIENKIVIVGTKISDQDRKLTPLNTQTKSYGVIIIAHGVSQILSAVEDRRPLLKLNNFYLDCLILIICSSIGAYIGWQRRKFGAWLLCLSGTIIIIYTVCYVLFIYNGLIIPIYIALGMLFITSTIAFISQSWNKIRFYFGYK